MKRRRTEKAITLIALIITIVILLILAIVAIGAINQSGIIAHAQNAAGDYKTKKGEEENTILGYEALIDEHVPGGENPPKEEIEEPEEYTLWKEPKSTNQTIGGATEGTSNNPIIPAGFMPKNTKLAKWDATNGPEADNGLVIVDTEGNEFVWVPVTTPISETGYGLGTEGYREPDIITRAYNSEGSDKILDNLRIAGVTDEYQGKGETLEDGIINEYDFKKILEDEYALMASSVNSNGGYYVGRYEVSIGSNGNAQSKTDGTNIVSATAAEDSANTWYGLYALCKKYETSSVKSSMISGAQYDAMMTWMGNKANITNSGHNTTRHPGYVKTDIIKNVYDLYGNSVEWTIEADITNCRVSRGGFYSYGFAPIRRFPATPIDDYGYDSNYGSRLALYIK